MDLRVVGALFVEDDAGKFIVIPLEGSFSLILVANHVQPPLMTDGAVNWLEVTRVKVSGLARGTGS